MYTVVTMDKTEGGDISVECYGPFNTKREAQRQADAIKRKCLAFVEYLLGDVIPEEVSYDIS